MMTAQKIEWTASKEGGACLECTMTAQKGEGTALRDAGACLETKSLNGTAESLKVTAKSV